MSDGVETLVFTDRNTWRVWLMTNHDQRREIWLVLPKKSAGGDSYRVFYNEALEEAICFGWIDSRIKRLDATRSLVRFTPRTGRNWSSINLAKALELKKKGKMTKAGLKVLPHDTRSKAKSAKCLYRTPPISGWSGMCPSNIVL
jgi:uncharacterized protein YdeI (YjbR/CyaY-like superfamily)